MAQLIILAVSVPHSPNLVDKTGGAGYWKIDTWRSTETTTYEDAYTQYGTAVINYNAQMTKLEADSANAQTKDKKLKLRLKLVDTEHSAIKIEIEAVQKILDDNVEPLFKTFA